MIHFFRLLMHASSIMRTFQLVADIVERVSKSDSKVPTCDDVRLLIGEARKLLEKGLIDIPNVDETELAKHLALIEANIVCSVTDAQRNFEKFGDVKARAALGAGEEKANG